MEQSKKKVCRISQISQVSKVINMKGSQGRDDTITTITHNEYGECIESECAHWRELLPRVEKDDPSDSYNQEGHNEIASLAATTNRALRREGPLKGAGIWILDASGYCGLAGKP